MRTVGLQFSADAFAEAVPFGLVVDSDGQIVVAGRALERLIKRSLPAPADEIFRVALPPGSESLIEALQGGSQPLLVAVLGTKIRLRGEVIHLDEDSGFAFLANPVATSIEDVNASGIRLQDFSAGDSTLDLLWSMQATQAALKDAETLGHQLKESAELSELAAQSKSRFLAVMSHEIRTPMNGLGSMVDLLGQTALTPEQIELLRTIDDCTSTLHTIVDDILDFSKLQDGAVEVESIPYRPADVVSRVERIFSASAASTDVAFGVNVDPDCLGWYMGDPVRIQQILSNLVSNAIKFSPDGCVVLSVTKDADNLMSMRVRDTGIGVPEAAQKHLFDPFTQADKSTNRKFGGTGLGLSIARSLATAMGGDLVLAESSPEGSLFELRIPMPEAAPPERRKGDVAAEGSEESGSGAGRRSVDALKVLVVDDNPTNRLVADRLLRKLGVNATIKCDGSEAIAAVARGEFDLVLMDLMMPGINGVEATHAIRKLPVKWSQVPIVAFSAGVMEEQVQEAKDAGMDDFLGKPVRLRELEALLTRYL